MIDHRLSIESSFFVGGWNARCSCGWVGKTRNTSDEALRDTTLHQEAGRPVSGDNSPTRESDR